MEEDRLSMVAEAQSEIQAPELEDIVKGYKEVDLPSKGKVLLFRPKQRDIDKADRFVAARKFELLQSEDRVPIEAELRKIYAERGVWTDLDDDRMDELRAQIASIIREQVEEIKDPNCDRGRWADIDPEAVEAYRLLDGGSESLALYKEVRAKVLKKVRDEFMVLRSRYNEYFLNTVEAFCNYYRQVYYCVSCFRKEDGSPVWSSVEEFGDEEADVFAAAISLGIKFWNGLDNDEGAGSFFDSLLAGQTSG